MTPPFNLLFFTFLSLLFFFKPVIAAPIAQGQRYLTLGEYSHFLNRVAPNDPHHLYDEHMATMAAPIGRQGTPGNYSYVINPGDEEKPFFYVNLNAARHYANWECNSGASNEEDNALTEYGIYNFEGDRFINTTSNATEILSIGNLYSPEEVQEASAVAKIDEELKSNQLTLLFKDKPAALPSGGEKIAPINLMGLCLVGLLIGFVENSGCRKTEREQTLQQKEEDFFAAESKYSESKRSESWDHEQNATALNQLAKKAKNLREDAQKEHDSFRAGPADLENDINIEQSEKKVSYWLKKLGKYNLEKRKILLRGNLEQILQETDLKKKVSQRENLASDIGLINLQIKSFVENNYLHLHEKKAYWEATIAQFNEERQRLIEAAREDWEAFLKTALEKERLTREAFLKTASKYVYSGRLRDLPLLDQLLEEAEAAKEAADEGPHVYCKFSENPKNESREDNSSYWKNKAGEIQLRKRQILLIEEIKKLYQKSESNKEELEEKASQFNAMATEIEGLRGDALLLINQKELASNNVTTPYEMRNVTQSLDDSFEISNEQKPWNTNWETVVNRFYCEHQKLNERLRLTNPKKEQGKDKRRTI